MGLERMKRDGWFREPLELDVSLTSEQLQELREFQEVRVRQDGILYSMKLRPGTNLYDVQDRDLRVEEIPKHKETVFDILIENSPREPKPKVSLLRRVIHKLGVTVLMIFGVLMAGFYLSLPVIGLILSCMLLKGFFEQKNWSDTEQIIPFLIVAVIQYGVSFQIWLR